MRFSVTTLACALLALALSASAAPAASAHLYGSNAWTNNAGTLLGGPGGAYGQSGSVEAGVRVLVDRCTQGWCKLRAGHQAGWFPLHQLNFGQRPGQGWDGPRLNYPSGGPGEVCFYSGANFSGSSFCAPPGTRVSDLALFNRDNTIRSVQVNGNTSAIVCSSFHLSGYCVRVIESRDRLPDGLAGSVSSLRVY